MDRFRILPAVFGAITLLACLPVTGQTAQKPAAPFRQGAPVTQQQRSTPFPAGPGTPDRQTTVQFRTEDEMSAADRDLVAGAESSIAERAGFEDLEFNEGRWMYRQIVCPAFPNHLFLRFTRNNGAGDVSIFSVSIPRGGDGRVRIIPILRRSYTLWSPAPINAMTIAAFNHIRAEDPTPHPYWLETALCYAALAGADPEAAPPAERAGTWEFPAGPPSVLELPDRGGAVVQFTNVADRAHPMQWTMTFNAQGRLLKTKHERAAMVAEHAENPAPVQEKPVPQGTTPIVVRPVVEAKAPPSKPIE
jgi:hypothetical protein